MYHLKTIKKRDVHKVSEIEKLLNDGHILERTVEHGEYVIYIFQYTKTVDKQPTKQPIQKKRKIAKKVDSDDD
tara:strand:- start:401 stop:619 length:219 start_codon:yes stop_codon:yes gene_type:complete